MNWLDDLLFDDAHPTREQREAARRRSRRIRKRSARRRSLKQQVDELRLVSLALYELLMERAPVTSEEVIARIEAIDLRDGVADGRVTPVEARPRCPACGRALLSSVAGCLYCGSPEAQAPDAE